MFKEIIDGTNKRSKIIKYKISENEEKLNLNLINKLNLEFIGDREVDKLRSFGDDKELCTSIIFDEEY